MSQRITACHIWIDIAPSRQKWGSNEMREDGGEKRERGVGRRERGREREGGGGGKGGGEREEGRGREREIENSKD